MRAPPPGASEASGTGARRSLPRRALGALFGGGCWALSAWLGAAVLLELYGATRPVPDTASTVVVAGAGVFTGGVPSYSLYARTTRAVSLFRSMDARTLAFTGGPRERLPAESEVAEQIALAQGVPPDVMIREERSSNTEENARELARELGDASIVVVTDRAHVLRCERVFRRYFSDVQVVGAVSPARTRMRVALREVAALLVYGVLGRL